MRIFPKCARSVAGARLLLLAFAAAQIIFLSAAGAWAQKAPSQSSRTQTAQKNPLVGRWQSDEATVEIRDDGRLTINGDEYGYRVKGSTITIFNDEGALAFPFTLEEDTLTVEVEGREVIYKRMKGSQNEGRQTDPKTRGANPGELVGKWCYLSNVNSGGGNIRMSNRCFTLYADGTYEYYAETSSGGQYGSSASQESDSGRWSATATTITSVSSKTGTNTYSLEKRNHPKTGDPMLILDGDAYVTAYQKNPW